VAVADEGAYLQFLGDGKRVTIVAVGVLRDLRRASMDALHALERNLQPAPARRD
jgi:hypothetical protein